MTNSFDNSTSNTRQITSNQKSKYLQVDEEDELSDNGDDSCFGASKVSYGIHDSSIGSGCDSQAGLSKRNKGLNTNINESHADRQEQHSNIVRNKIPCNPTLRNIDANRVQDNLSSDILNLDPEEQLEDMNSINLLHRYDILSKKCNKLSKENISLQRECDRLTKENQLLKKTTIPMPDSAGRQWFINVAKLFCSKTPDTDIVKYANMLGVNDPRDLVACLQDTTSNTARQVVRLLYSSDKLLTMTGPQMPESQRLVIRQFAESQRGPISNHKFNEAINGVFRSSKNEFKNKQQDTHEIQLRNKNRCDNESNCLEKGQTTLLGIMKGKQQLRMNYDPSGKENNGVTEDLEEQE